MDESVLENYYLILLNKLRSGTDKISPSKYRDIRNNDFNVVVKKFNNHTYHFTPYSKQQIGKRIIHSPCIRDKIILKYLSDLLQQKYQITYISRESIISQLVNILRDDINYSIFRIDIRSFYDSIYKKIISAKLIKTSLLTSQEYNLVKGALKGKDKGLPQGLSISAALSEIAMENIDYQLKRLSNCQVYYSRYVDDIIIIFHGRIKKEETQDKVKSILENSNLSLNMQKTCFVDDFEKRSGKSFEYLGYKFSYPTNIKELTISISESKILKEKDKIRKVFLDFIINRNLSLLQNRLLTLTRTNYILTVGYKNIYNNYKYISKFGLCEAYRSINDLKCLSELDDYLKHCISYYCASLTNAEKRTLFCYSYLRSFEKKEFNAYHKYTKDDYISKLERINPSLVTADLLLKDITELKTMYFNFLKT